MSEIIRELARCYWPIDGVLVRRDGGTNGDLQLISTVPSRQTDSYLSCSVLLLWRRLPGWRDVSALFVPEEEDDE